MIKQTFNKVLILLCTISLLLGCFVQPAMAKEFSDTQNHTHSYAIDILSAIGVVEGDPDGCFRPDDFVTRAEIVTMILRATEVSAYVGNSADNPFTDTVGHWAKDNISFAFSMGYVSGNGDGTFSPDENVTYEQAVKMVINMIDYGFVAEGSGGYPNGYILVAAQNKVTDGIDSGIGKALTRGQVAQLIYNAMNTPMLVQDSFGDDASYSKGTEKDTLMAKFTLDTQGYGIVTKTAYTGLDSKVGTDRENMVEITVDEKRYLMDKGNTDAFALLGKEVDFLAVSNPRDEDKYTLVYIKETDRDSITVKKQDIIDADYDNRTFTYYNEKTDKQKVEKLAADVSVLYNNKYVEKPQKADMIPDNGYVVLVENNGRLGYDAVFVYDFDNGVVSSSFVDDDVVKVYFKTEGKVSVSKLEVETKDADDYVITYIDGKYIDKEDLLNTQIPEWTVASVAKSKDESVSLVHFCTKVVSGTVDGSRDDDGKLSYSIDGEWYYTAPELSDQLKLGDNYTVAISFDGKIVAVNTDVTDITQNYALLLDCKMKDNGIEDDVATFKLLLSDGHIVAKDAAKKVRINSGSAIKLSEGDLDKLPQNTLILFTENGDGKINSIETADDSNVCLTTNGYIDYGDENVFTLNASTNLYYKTSSPSTLGGDVKVNEKTLVFDVSSSDEEEWGTGDITLFNNETVYMVDIYDIDKFKMAKVVVNHGPALEQDDLIPWGNAPVVIEAVYNKLDEEGNAVRVLCGMQNGKEFQMKLKDSKLRDEDKSCYLVDLKPGSVIQIKTNMLGEIVSFRKLYRAPSKTEVFETLGSKNWEGADYNVKLHTAYGMCVDINEQVMTVAFRLDDKVTAYSIADANIYVFDTKNQTVEPGDYTDAKPASSYGYDDCTRVFVRMEKDNVKDIVIFD